MNFTTRGYPGLTYKMEPGIWSEAPLTHLPTQSKYVEMLEWQKRCFGKLKDKSSLIVIAPCGSGKSKMVDWFVVDDRLTTRRKQLIVVPQKGTSDGYSRTKDKAGKNKKGVSLKYKGKDILFDPHNLCYHDLKDSRIRILIDFLLKPSTDIPLDSYKDIMSQGCVVTTHQAFVKALNKIYEDHGEDGIKKAFEDTSLYIDECHHCDSDGVTGMGGYLQMLLRTDINNFRICLASATFYRGDGKLIISKESYNLFNRFTLRWDEYIQSTGIEDFFYDFVYFERNPIDDMVQRILSEPEEYHLIILPRTGHSFRRSNTLEKIIDKLKDGGVPQETIIDMVTKTEQDKSWKRLTDDNLKYHIVIACDMFNEGKDWPPCSRIYDGAFNKSVVSNYQKPGRAFRPWKGKRVIRIFCYVKKCPIVISSDKLKDFFDDRFNVLITVLIWEEHFNPIKIPTLPNKSWIGSDNEKSDQKSNLNEILGDTAMKQFIEDLMGAYESCKVKNGSSIRAVATSVCKKYYNDTIIDQIDFDEFVKVAILKIVKANLTVKHKSNIEAEKIDFSYLKDKGLAYIEEKEPFLGSLIYGTEENIFNLIPHYRKILKEKLPNFEGIRKIADIVEDGFKYKNKIEIVRHQQKVSQVPLSHEVPIGSWVNLKGTLIDSKKDILSLKTSVGVILNKINGIVNVRVYPNHEVSFTKGEVYLNKLYTRSDDREFWKPYFKKNVRPYRAKKLKGSILSDSSISKVVQVSADQIKLITF